MTEGQFGRHRPGAQTPKRSLSAITAKAVAVGVIGFGAMAVVGPTVAYAEPSDCGRSCDNNVTPNFGNPFGGQGSSDSTDKGSRHDHTIPQFEPPDSTVSNRPVIVRRTPNTPEDIPPVVIPDPGYDPVPIDVPVDIPVDIPPVPVEAPVVVPEVPVIPVAAPVVPPPAATPVIPPPAAPQVPAPATPQVLLTSSAEPGTQALTVILLFAAVVAWAYGHRIASHWAVGKTK